MFYTLSAAAAYETNGDYPQITLADYKKEAYIFNLSHDNFWKDETKLDCFKLSKRFIPTDFCTISHINYGKGIVVSQNVKIKFDLLLKQGYNFNPHKYYPLLFSDSSVFTNYYFLQILSTKEIIDYNNSVFENLLSEEYVSIESHDQYKIEFYPAKIYINKEIDLFIHPYDGELFISERLKKCIEDSGFSGYEEIQIFNGAYELLNASKASDNR